MVVGGVFELCDDPVLTQFIELVAEVLLNADGSLAVGPNLFVEDDQLGTFYIAKTVV